jgi:hypothetical protein
MKTLSIPNCKLCPNYLPISYWLGENVQIQGSQMQLADWLWKCA